MGDFCESLRSKRARWKHRYLRQRCTYLRAPSVARRGAERVAVFGALEGRERSECIRDALGSSSWISKWIFLAKQKTKKTKKHWRLRRIQNSCFYEQSAVVLPALQTTGPVDRLQRRPRSNSSLQKTVPSSRDK